MVDREKKMTGEQVSSLNHFCVYALTRDYWRLSEKERAELRSDWLSRLAGAADSVEHYRTTPTRTGSDILVWCAVRMVEPATAQHFFDAHTEAIQPFRPYVRMKHVLWGFTRASQYGGARSKGAIDPFGTERGRYLIAYPFSKTVDWYLTPRDERQVMMNEHIRIGRSYEGITQLLLYSTGLQDHEFVVVYETEDLPRFSELVRELRGTEARAHTLLDAPVHVAVHASADSPEKVWP